MKSIIKSKNKNNENKKDASSIETNKSIINSLEEDIEILKTSNKYYNEKINYLSTEIELKQSELAEKKKILKQTKHKYKQTQKSFDKSSEINSKETIESFVELFRKPASSIIKGIADEYSKTTSSLYTSSHNKSSNVSSTTLFVLYSTSTKEHALPFKITDQFYCFIDLLKEVCRFFNISNPSEFNLYDEEENIIDLTKSVIAYLPTLTEKTNDVPRIKLKPIPVQTLFRFNFDTYKDARLIPKKPFDRSGRILTNLENIEDHVIKRIRNILFYLLFLILVFINVMNKLNIKQRFLIYDVFNSQIIQHTYFQDNKYKLENKFTTISSIDDAYNWLSDVFIQSFNFKDQYYDFSFSEKYPKNITTFMQDYIVIGKVRFAKISSEKKNEDYAINSHISEVYANYTNITKYSKLDKPIDYSGDLDSYRTKYAYYSDVSPTTYDMNMNFGLMKQISFLSSKMKCFIIMFNLYNANSNYLIPITIAIEKNNIGYIAHSFEICTLTFLNELSNIKHFKIFKSSLLLIIIYYFLIVLYAIKTFYTFIYDTFLIEENRKTWYLKVFNLWTIIQLLKASLLIITLIMRLYIYVKFSFNFTDFTNQNIFYDPTSLCNLYDYLIGFEMLMLCLILIYFIEYLDENIVGPFFNTIMSSIRNVLRYLTCFFFTVFGVSSFCSLAYGKYIVKMSSLIKSFEQMLLLIFWDFSIEKNMEDSYWGLTKIVIVVFSITFFILYSDWLIVTIVMGYEKYMIESQKKSNTIKGVSVIKEKIILKDKMIRSIKILGKKVIGFIKEVVKKIKKENKKDLNKDEGKMFIEMENIDEQKNEKIISGENNNTNDLIEENNSDEEEIEIEEEVEVEVNE